MQSFESHEAGARDAQMCVSDGGASHAASCFALPDDQLYETWTFLVCLVLAPSLVDLVNFIVAAS